MSKSSDGSNTAEIEQQRQMDARSRAVTASTEVNQPHIKSRRPSETQSQSSTGPQHHHLCQTQSQFPSLSPVQSQTSSQAMSQPYLRVRSQPPSHPQPQSEVLPQSPFQTQPPLSSPADLHPQFRVHSQPLNMLTPAETVRDDVHSEILQDIRSCLKYIKGLLQRLVKDQSDINASLTRGVEEFRQDKANGLESRFQKLEGEQEQPGTPLSNRILTKHVIEKSTEEQDKELISEDNYARSYDHQVYKSKQQDRTTKVYKSKKIDHTTKSKHCCNSKKRKKNKTIEDYCFDDIVCKSKSTPKENMLQGSFSDEDIREFRKFSFNNRAGNLKYGYKCL